MRTKTLTEQAEEVRWWHSIELPGGVITPGLDDSKFKLRTLGMPDDLTGKSVLDIGAWDGFFSFEAERRGAARVLATDWYEWGGPGWGTRAGFDLARAALCSNVEDLEIDVFDISPETVGTFDVVLFLGVLYHLRHPLLALERVFSVTGDMLILETHIDLVGRSRPAMAFYPNSECSGNPTNWWGPNPAAVEGMLRTAGFEKVRRVAEYPLAYRLGRMLKYRRAGVFQLLQQSRMVFHAWR